MLRIVNFDPEYINQVPRLTLNESDLAAGEQEEPVIVEMQLLK